MLRYILVFIFAACNLISHEISTFSGTAYNERHEHVFTEEYSIERDGDKILSVTTCFRSPKGEVLAEMTSSFPENDHLAVVSFEKKEATYGTILAERTIELFKTTGTQVRKHKSLPIKDNMVAGHGFYFYIIDHLEDLLQGKTLQMAFLQPNRLTAYTFNMKAHKTSDHLVKVQLNIDNRLLKAFVPEITLVIDQKTKTLVSYEGLSGFLAPEEGSLKKISITYTEPVSLKKGAA